MTRFPPWFEPLLLELGPHDDLVNACLRHAANTGLTEVEALKLTCKELRRQKDSVIDVHVEHMRRCYGSTIVISDHGKGGAR